MAAIDRFIDRPLCDLLMFYYTMGLQRGIPSVSDERAAEFFVKQSGFLFGDASTGALRSRLQRMKKDYIDAQKEYELEPSIARSYTDQEVEIMLADALGVPRERVWAEMGQRAYTTKHAQGAQALPKE